MKNMTTLLSTITLGLVSLTLTANELVKTPDLKRSKIVTVDHVGDITGDAAAIAVHVKDVNGLPLSGVTVKLESNRRTTVFSTVVGKTDANGVLNSLLLSNKISMVTVKAYIDTDNDGEVDSPLDLDSELISFIDDLEFSNGVGINVDDPDDSAVLHVFSTDRGVMIPRVALQGCSDKLTIIDPALSLLVFNTNASDTLDVGYVFFDGQDWKNFVFR